MGTGRRNSYFSKPRTGSGRFLFIIIIKSQVNCAGICIITRFIHIIKFDITGQYSKFCNLGKCSGATKHIYTFSSDLNRKSISFKVWRRTSTITYSYSYSTLSSYFSYIWSFFQAGVLGIRSRIPRGWSYI